MKRGQASPLPPSALAAQMSASRMRFQTEGWSCSGAASDHLGGKVPEPTSGSIQKPITKNKDLGGASGILPGRQRDPGECERWEQEKRENSERSLADVLVPQRIRRPGATPAASLQGFGPGGVAPAST